MKKRSREGGVQEKGEASMKQWARTWLRTGALAAMVGAALLFVAAPRAKAQGGIAGTLLDLDGKPWADTTITLEGDQGAKTDTKTDNAGKYVFTGLKAGIYKLSVMLPFQKTPYVAGQVKVSGSDTVTAELNLLELVAKKNPEYAAAVKKQAEDLKKAGGMKAHFDAGVAKLDQVKDKKAALAKAPAEQRDALKQDLTDTATQAVTELEASKAAAPEKDSNLPLILSRLGDAYEAAGRSDDAIAAYKSAVEIKPTAPIYLNLGGIQGRAGKSDDAIASFQKAAELDPANAAQAWRNAGIILSNAGKYAEAVEPLKKSTELDPKSAIGWYLLGGALVANIKYKKVGDKDVPDIPAGTAEAYQHAIELDPNGPYGKESKAALDALQQMAPGITTRVTEKKKKP
ncbi:MAG TPA: tetratricopeptide repeat protein [Candidatus Acidoferrum sp.]|nr:tetratricopeptide repeat protein [Candidatus Acidoferrum sp.]